MGSGCSTSRRRSEMRLLRGISGRKREARPAAEFPFTGNCPVRQHTADGAGVGRCWHSTYQGVCPVHGEVSEWLKPDADLKQADDRLLPPREQLDFGPPELRAFLGAGD